MGEKMTSHVWIENNFSDFMTKVTYGQKRRHLVSSILFGIYDDHFNKNSDLQKLLLNDCWMNEPVPSKSNLLIQTLNLRGLRKLGQVETRRFPPNPASLRREGVFFPEQKEASRQD